jgi:hypothetical protein
MLRPSTHEEDQAFVKESLLEQLVNNGQGSVLFTYAELIAKMWLTDLTPVASLVAPATELLPGERRPRDPVCLFRSILLIRLAGYTGITKWAQALKSFPFFAILSGWQTERRSATKIRNPLPPRHRKGKKNEKLPLARPSIVDRMVKRILRQESQPLPARPEDVLNAIFQQVFVKPSGQKGLSG